MEEVFSMNSKKKKKNIEKSKQNEEDEDEKENSLNPWRREKRPRKQ